MSLKTLNSFKKQLDQVELEIFNNVEFDSYDITNNNSLCIVRYKSENILPLNLYNKLYDYIFKYINEHLKIDCTQNSIDLKLIILSKQQVITNSLISDFLNEYKKHNEGFNLCYLEIYSNSIKLIYSSKKDLINDENYISDLKLFLYDYGIICDINLEYRQGQQQVQNEFATYIPKVKQENNIKNGRTNLIQERYKGYNLINLIDLTQQMDKVKIIATIFKIELEKRNRKSDGSLFLSGKIYVSQGQEAVIVSAYASKLDFMNELLTLKKGQTCAFYGDYLYDQFAKDNVLKLVKFEKIDNQNIEVKDPNPLQRVELHSHSKYSEMDSVASCKDLINTAFNRGSKAIAISDHLCVQGFHSMYLAHKDIMKKNPNTDFKVIYGCEMNMVEPRLSIVYNPDDRNLKDVEYVVFDLETTGLSARYDSIIEFGATTLYKGQIKNSKNFFIRPNKQVSAQIKQLTNISDKDLLNAKSFKELANEIKEYVNGKVLVAHNASFDFSFLNEHFKNIGEDILDNAVIDTLDLARSMFKEKRAFRLSNIARQYGVDYDEEVAHRANYDAEVLASTFNLMLKEILNNGINTLNELANYQDEEAFIKNRASHVNVIAKNLDGLKDLYKLITISNTKSLAVFGKPQKEDSDYMAEPRIFKETLNQYRKNLLLGSCCLNGEVFEIAHTRNKDELAKAISFYDFIELQPLTNYSYLYQDRKLFTIEDLMQYQKDIILEASKQNKIIVATGDVHYINKDDKILRDVYINAQGIGGVHHPLYLFDKEKRKKQITPDQHFFTTQEMLDKFKWLDDEKLVKEIVVENTNKIADMCEFYYPFDSKLHAPVLNDAINVALKCEINEEPFIGVDKVISADDYLRQLVQYNAHQKFGQNLPKLIEDRIEKELNAIIGNGYGVIYFVCHLLVKKSNIDGYTVGSRGSVGSSLVATLSEITEVDPLPPYYLCSKCKNIEFIEDVNVRSGFDLPKKKCKCCNIDYLQNGQNIPFETFLGFEGDKIPDIDLNFAGDYQKQAHLFTRTIFGQDNVFRAGTILTIAEKTAFGYLNNYLESKEINDFSSAKKELLVQGLTDVKRTTGQHAGGIVVLPNDMQIEEITPIQYPANDQTSQWKSTHFEYHDYNDNLLKFDILGHDDPKAIKLLEDITGISIDKVPLNDEKVLSLFTSCKNLGLKYNDYDEKTGALGIPEFGTQNARKTVEETKPTLFSELVQLSGLSHGTGVYRGNARELIINDNIALSDVIGCRDDIMTRLIEFNVEPKTAFSIMEKVRKGKGLTDEESNLLEKHNVPKWYIESCKKIEYMFPKAHAVAYVIMAMRIGWFKVYKPEHFYISYLSLRSDAFEINTMIQDREVIKKRMDELKEKINNRIASKKEKDIFDTLEIVYEMKTRGIKLNNINLDKSQATRFCVDVDDQHAIVAPFVCLDGLGENVALSIVNQRQIKPFANKKDLANRTILSKTHIGQLEQLKVLDHLDESDQMTLF